MNSGSSVSSADGSLLSLSSKRRSTRTGCEHFRWARRGFVLGLDARFRYRKDHHERRSKWCHRLLLSSARSEDMAPGNQRLVSFVMSKRAQKLGPTIRNNRGQKCQCTFVRISSACQSARYSSGTVSLRRRGGTSSASAIACVVIACEKFANSRLVSRLGK